MDDENLTPSEAVETGEDEEETSVNQIVDSTPVVDDQPTMSPQVLWSFCNDVAQNIMPYREVATRYGFTDVAQLKEFLIAQEGIRKRVKEIRAVWASDDNVEVRIKHLTQHALLHAVPGTAQIMLNPRNPDATRLDALLAHAKIAGMGHAPVAGAGGGPAGGRFSVNIMFPNAGKIETFTTIDATPEKDDAA